MLDHLPVLKYSMAHCLAALTMFAPRMGAPDMSVQFLSAPDMSVQFLSAQLSASENLSSLAYPQVV